MLFYETKTKDGYNYRMDHFIGMIIIDSPARIGPEKLDEIVVALSSLKIKAKTISGEIEELGVRYQFIKADPWIDDDEDNNKNKIKNVCLSKNLFGLLNHWLKNSFLMKIWKSFLSSIRN